MSTRSPWRRRKVLVRAGGNFFYETPIVFRLGAASVISFGRDDDGDLLLSLRMPTTSGQPRARIADGFWQVRPDGAALVCPSSGRVLDIAYPNGDRFRAEFTDVHSARALQVRYGSVARWAYRVQFPVTMALVAMTVAGTDLAFGPDTTEMEAPTRDCFTSHGQAAVDVRMTQRQLDGLFPGP